MLSKVSLQDIGFSNVGFRAVGSCIIGAVGRRATRFLRDVLGTLTHGMRAGCDRKARPRLEYRAKPQSSDGKYQKRGPDPKQAVPDIGTGCQADSADKEARQCRHPPGKVFRIGMVHRHSDQGKRHIPRGLKLHARG